MAAGKWSSSRGAKRKTVEENDSAPASRCQREDYVVKERASAPIPKSLRLSIDSKCEFSVVVRSEGIDIIPVENVANVRFLFEDADAAGEPKTVIVVHRQDDLLS